MQPTHLEIAQSIVEELKSEFNDELVGLIVGGSATFGTFDRRSDLDLLALIASERRQRRAFHRQELPIELLIRPAKNFETQFADTDTPEMLSFFVRGQVTYDPLGRLRQLQQRAQTIWQQGRPAQPLVYPFLEKMRLVPYDLLDDAQDLLERDPLAAKYVMQHALQVVIEAHLRLRRLWSTKPKHILMELRGADPEIAQQIEMFLDQGTSLARKFKILAKLVDTVLAPLGGRLGDWTSPWEVLGQDGKWRIERVTS